MSVEPNQPMEAQLRTHAERRRLEAPPFELDGATRQRLQEEVRKVYWTEPTPSGVARSGWFWARLGLVGAATAAALFLSVQLLEQPPSFFPGQPAAADLELAAVEESVGSSELFDRGVNAPSPAPMMAGRTSPADSLSVPELAQSAEVASAEGKLTARAETAAVPGVSRTAIASGPAVTGEMRMMTQPANETAEVEDSMVGGALRSGQQFQQVQQYRRNPNSPAPPRVLRTFHWIREGDVVRVIDEDGSVYTGALGASASGAGSDRYALSVSTKPAVGGAAPPAQLRQLQVDGVELGERFMVMGTNRTLNVPVRFEGVFLAQPGLAQIITNNALGVDSSAVSQAAAQIQGQALVGGFTRLGIVADARPE